MSKLNKGRLLAIAIGVLVIGAALFAWQSLQKKGLPDGFTSGNGRIEAVEIDIAAKTAGRLKDILVDEGDFITAGQVLAKMDTAVLEAQLREGLARLRQAGVLAGCGLVGAGGWAAPPAAGAVHSGWVGCERLSHSISAFGLWHGSAR